MEDKDMLTQIKDLRAAQDARYAAVRPKFEFIVQLIRLRTRLGLTQAEVARRMGVTPSRVNEIEVTPDKVSLDRIQAYASALGAHFSLVLPETPEALLAAQVGTPEIDVKAVGTKLRELAVLLEPLAHAKG